LPRELKELEKIQHSHHAAVTQNMMIQWRDFLIGEIQDKLRKNHNFFEAQNSNYEASPLKRIISRFEYILNTYLREFVKISIDDYVQFIREFTNPDLSVDELWKVNSTPFIVIHLSILKKVKKDAKKKDSKKKEDKDAKPEEGEVVEDDDDKNKITYKPTIEECHGFVINSMDMIIDSTNSVNNLESDLMPFLQKEYFPNFKINREFPWIKEAIIQLNQMINSNVSGPNALLEEYKKYEYILNIDKKELIDDLFKGGEDGQKKSL